MSRTGRIALLGAGGHAKVVLATLRAAGYAAVDCFDDRPELHGTELLGAPVIGALSAACDGSYAGAVIGIGDNAGRAKLAALDLPWLAVAHPHAWVHDSVRLGGGAVVFAGAVLQPDVVLGAHAVVNTGASVDHDGIIGEFAHVAPGCHLAGNVRVGCGALLGVGVAAIPGTRVGAWSVVGAGAAIVADIPDRVLAVGVPARVVRPLEACRR